MGVSSTKAVVDILPQRTSSRGEHFFVLMIHGMVFFLQDTDLIFPSLQMVAAATDSVDS